MSIGKYADMIERIERLEKENAELRAQRDSLQSDMSRIVNNQGDRQVHDFMKLINQDVPTVVQVPCDQVVRLRAELQVEEGIEFAMACFTGPFQTNYFKSMLGQARDFIRDPGNELKVDLVAAIDATYDSDYVSSGARWAFGVQNHNKLRAIVHRKNMEKGSGGKDPITGKGLKPAGWVGPEAELRAELIAQGWKP